MIKYFIWTASFIGLYLSIFWIQIIYLKEKIKTRLKDWPSVSIIVPARNEENTLEKTIDSLCSADYPKEKLQIIIVNDESTDKTKDVAERLIKKHKGFDIILLNRKKKSSEYGKAPALNAALKKVKHEFVGCLDADSTIDRKAIKKMVPLFFLDEKVAAVISTIKVSNPYNIYSKIQRLEYILSTFVRTLMSKINTLHVTPGALSIYRTDVLKKLGGFDEHTLTEDYEIAMRLKYYGYNIKMQNKAVSYTNVPDNFKDLWNQRVRWFRGFITTAAKFKKMFGKKQFGMMGVFQYPINILSFVLVIMAFVFLTYELVTKIYKAVIKLIILKGGVVEVIRFPTTKELLLSINPNIMLPVVMSFAAAIYIYHRAHHEINEPWKNPGVLLVYFFIYPLVRGAQWLAATYKEAFKTKRKW